MQCVSSLVAIYSVVHFEANKKYRKTLYGKNAGQASVLLSQSTVEEELVIH